MPGIKRVRASPSEGHDEESDYPDSESSKRPRLSSPSPSDEESVASGSDEEAEQQIASQFHQELLQQKGAENIAAENGIVESIECCNFMCHSYLHVDVGPLINFIIGHNGSGKSAVLTALTLSLGGKASATNRGGSLKSFIKEGADTCTLKVRIKNRGETGYQQELYGNCITVERSFNRAGTSGFKLRSATDRIISTRKADLEEISDYYALQIDNPINVLTQDHARQFLSGSSPADKYKFFLKGIQLEQLRHDYELFAESIEQIVATFGDKQAQVATLIAKCDKAKNLLEMVDRHQQVRKRINELGAQRVWSQVEEQERQLAAIDEKIRENDEQINQVQSRIERVSAVYDELVSKQEEADQRVEQCKSDRAPLEMRKGELSQEHEDVKLEGQELQKQQRIITEEIKKAKSAIAKSSEAIDAEKRRLEELHGGNFTRRHTELEEKKKAAKDARSAWEDHLKEKRQLHNEQSQAQQRLEEYANARGSKVKLLREAEQRLRNLHQNADRRQAYPRNMDKLMSVVQRDTGFEQKPLGPIADFVHLKKPTWSGILEKSFGGTLNAFIVTSKSDQARLSQLMHRIGCVVPIFIGSHSTFEFSDHEPDLHYETILRALTIDNPMVLRQLIINHNIEQIILIEDMNEARNAIMGHRLRNVKACFSIQPGNRGIGERFAYGADDGVATNYMDVYQGLPRMQTDLRNQIDFESGNIRQFKLDLDEHDNTHKTNQQELKIKKTAILRHEKEANDLKVAYQRLEDQVEELKNALDNDRVEEGRLEALKDGLTKEEENKARLENSYRDSVNAKDEYLERKKIQLEKRNRLDGELLAAGEMVRKAEEKAEQAEQARHNALTKKNKTFQEAQSLKEEREEQQEQRVSKARGIDEITSQAARISARVEVPLGESNESLERKLQKLTADLTRYQRQIGGDAETISNDYTAAAYAAKAAQEQVAEDERLATLLDDTYNERIFRWEKFKQYITARARIMFSHFMSERGFLGHLKINHRAKLLDIHVQPDETQRDRQGRQTKTLSGGEKSFSQICLLLSLWEAIGAPIRCLDEFDVFMDSVNREASMKLLVNAARNSVGRQFVLITPQSMASIDATNDVKIIKMRDPERNQATLSFERR